MSHSSSSQIQESAFAIEPLEPRLLLAGITFDSGTGVVTIDGSGADDIANVSDLGGGLIQVELVNVDTQQFLESDLTQIRFNGRNGNDQFDNTSNVSSLASGHAGDDQLRGGSANDRLLGGPGDDLIYGRGGLDWLYGHDSNDQLYGGDHDDYLDGADGNDILNGDGGNDTILGGGGSDTLRGFSGDDILDGGLHNDTLYGQNGEDNLNGGDGADRLRGGPGNDQLTGGGGNDYMDGDADNDVLTAGGGNDQVFGNTGLDRLYGNAGDDFMRGGAGADIVRGGPGKDSLFGGDLTDADRLIGDQDSDRFLVDAFDTVNDLNADDAQLNFVDVSSNWTTTEVEVMDDGFALLHARTTNATLLNDALPSGPLTFYKYDSLGGALGVNYLSWFWNGQGFTYNREIRIAEWNENSSYWNGVFAEVVVHEIAHNWDSAMEIENVVPSLEGLWESFEAVSGWTDTDPNDPANYTQSNDGQWWYLNTANFARNYGRTNPNEDFATMFEYYFFDYQNAGNHAPLQSKLDILDQLFDQL